MTAARRLAFVALFVSLAWTTVPRLAEYVRKALELRDQTLAERRIALFGAFYQSILRIDGSLPRHEPVAAVADQRADIDAALFFAHYVFPRPLYLYVGLDAYRMDRKAPRRIVRFDESRSPEGRVMTYAAVRAETIGSNHVVRRLEPPAETARRFVIPIASSGDGPAPDVYTTEAVMENAGAEAAHVRVEMFPGRRTAEIVLQPGERRTWADFVHDEFGVLEVGWLRVESDQPLRARFWFVNRGRADADPLPPVRWLKKTTLNLPAPGRLWVLNPHDYELRVRLNELHHRLPPHSLILLEWIGVADAEADAEWYAFMTWRDASRNTNFIWPEER